MESVATAIDEGLEKIDAHCFALKSAKEGVVDDNALAELVAGSLRYHREERARWRKAVQLLPAHLKVNISWPFGCHMRVFMLWDVQGSRYASLQMCLRQLRFHILDNKYIPEIYIYHETHLIHLEIPLHIPF